MLSLTDGMIWMVAFAFDAAPGLTDNWRSSLECQHDVPILERVTHHRSLVLSWHLNDYRFGAGR